MTNGSGDKNALPKHGEGLIEKHQRLESELSWLSGNLFRPGMILPFHGSMTDALALAKEGWVVCDGKQPINDPKAAARFKGTTSPDLSDRFLKGSNAAGNKTGSATVNT